jgi:hypothetical protein
MLAQFALSRQLKLPRRTFEYFILGRRVNSTAFRSDEIWREGGPMGQFRFLGNWDNNWEWEELVIENMVARDGIEPPTPAFSGLRESIIATTSWHGWR